MLLLRGIPKKTQGWAFSIELSQNRTLSLLTSRPPWHSDPPCEYAGGRATQRHLPLRRHREVEARPRSGAYERRGNGERAACQQDLAVWPSGPAFSRILCCRSCDRSEGSIVAPAEHPQMGLLARRATPPLEFQFVSARIPQASKPPQIPGFRSQTGQHVLPASRTVRVMGQLWLCDRRASRESVSGRTEIVLKGEVSDTTLGT